MAGLLKPASQKSKIRRLGNQPTDNPGRNPSTRPSGLVYLIECRLEMEMRRRSFVCMGLVSAAGLVTVSPTAAQKSGHVTSISSLATSIGRKAEEVRADISATRTHSLPNLVRIDPTPLYQISPYLHMQFMEPLGVTDSAVEAAWDYDTNDWRADFVATVRDLAPDVIRWGGLLSRYYKWREGVGPVQDRPPMRNYVWGGWETNRVGTGEFVDLCNRTGAAPIVL